MSYSFAEVEAALAQLNSIASTSRSAFANRLKHLQRKGFPPGVNTGRGKAASYGAEHVVQLALALELISFGYSPEKAIAVMRQSVVAVAEGIDRVTDFNETILCNFQPNGLSDLQDKVEFDEDELPLQWLTADQALEGIGVITHTQSAGARIALFSLSGVVSLCASFMTWDRTSEDRREFFDQLNSWARGILDGDT